MAHVLLPCDMPSWTELQRLLSQLRLSQNAEQLIGGMQKIHDMCNIGLDPDETPVKGDNVRFDNLKSFFDETLNDEERQHFFKVTLPNLVNNALRLRLVKPVCGFNYSLQQEDGMCSLDRRFVASLIANAFFSTFPKRSPKTHPTLQDFNFGEFFRHLKSQEQQVKLKHFLNYFGNINADDLKGSVRFYRQTKHFRCCLSKVLGPKSVFSLPSWLCSDRSLCPLIPRKCGSIEETEFPVYKVWPCSPLPGNNALRSATNQETYLFCRFPELLTLLCFTESLQDNEAVIIEGLLNGGLEKESKNANNETDICLMDTKDFSEDPLSQYKDCYLLRELTKAFAAFNQVHCCRRPSPVGESSSSSTCPEGMSPTGRDQPPLAPLCRPAVPQVPSTESSKGKKRSSDICHRIDWRTESVDKKERRSIRSRPSLSSQGKSTSQDKVSEGFSVGEKTKRPPVALQKINAALLNVVAKLPETQLPKSSPSYLKPKSLSANHSKSSEMFLDASDLSRKNSQCVSRMSSNSLSRASSSWSSMKTASQSSFEQTPVPSSVRGPSHPRHTRDRNHGSGRPPHAAGEDEYFTAESSDEENGGGHRTVRESRARAHFLAATPSDRQISEEENSRGTQGSRSNSVGFVLDGSDDDESQQNLSIHERYDDFRKRIRRRSRRLSRRSSRSSYLSSSGSSDMEDILEDPEVRARGMGFQPIRPANSEPSLLRLSPDQTVLVPPIVLPPETVILALGGKKLMMTTSNGQLKAYSYDGVNPNLPVPFKAKFRRRHHSDESMEEKYSAMPDTFWYVPPPSGSAVTSASSSVDDLSGVGEERGESGATISRSLSSAHTEDRIADESIMCSEFLMTSADGKRPMATCSWSCDHHGGDVQLKAVIHWLAASMAFLPCLTLYTSGDPHLEKMTRVYRIVLERKWSVGDLACETLRYCRNKLSAHSSSTADTGLTLFGQLLGEDNLLSQHSLD